MSDRASALSGALNRPFTEQVAFFRNKMGNRVPTQRWDDIIGAQHDTAFMVAGATKADLLSDLAAAVDKAIAEGRGLEQFRADFRDIVKRNGWTGWTGEGSTRGEAWRVRTILSTNSYTSYAAGRYAQLVAGNFKYWVYRHGGSKDPRPEHLEWDGLILPPDHPFWATFYPPSDWGCSCYVVGANSMAQAKRLGGDSNVRLRDGWNAVNPATGVPDGAGRGWNYAPGASVANIVQAMAAKIRGWDFGVARAFMRGLPVAQQDILAKSYRSLPSTSDDTRRIAASIFEERRSASDPKLVKSLGMVPSNQEARIEQLIGKKIGRSDFRMTSDFVNHVRANHTDAAIEASRRQRPVVPADFARLPLLLDAPDSISGPEKSRTGETIVKYRKRFGTEVFTAIITVNRRSDSLGLKTFYIGI